MTVKTFAPAALAAGFLLLCAGAGAAPTPAPKSAIWVRYPAVPDKLSPAAELGKQIFFDATLSGSGQMSCATCHSPDHAFGPANGLAVQPGGVDMKHAGARAVPSLRYLTFTPLFTRHYYVPASEDSDDEGPTGGFMRDGAMSSLREQMAMPMLNPDEMANASREAVVAKLRRAPYAGTFAKVYGANVWADPARAFVHAGEALEAFETEDPAFHPFTSKFDAVMSGHATFSPAELRGLTAFSDPDKGNCAQCHVASPGPGGRPAAFTDYSFVALGLPRNKEIPANQNPAYFDMGLCGPVRTDMRKETQYCGMFKTPTLRNVAGRTVFFHNGVFHTLDDAVRFYSERDSKAGKWFPRAANGKVDLYNDLPVAYRANVDHTDPPFNHGPAKPVLNDAQIRDIVAFLKTLDDGYSSVAGGPARNQLSKR
ncbi:cytochrome-c peroxidase [Silvimonas iriomotensis]|uniref:Cytochrome-c peroxidase n=1 Tax=Silvimonas iriomotensis TaxID=449662 RepID=A0ABQ2PAF0_9NEIS|nr:cytochrome c peroxidase [Silvimonas iriomotensis]GGP22327.1 cytochrome-c peroxidase [Silvimonas iriomotensis]